MLPSVHSSSAGYLALELPGTGFLMINGTLTRYDGTEGTSSLERLTGIEPASSAWEAEALPLSYSRNDLMRWY